MPAMTGDISHATNADEIELEIQTLVSSLPISHKSYDILFFLSQSQKSERWYQTSLAKPVLIPAQGLLYNRSQPFNEST